MQRIHLLRVDTEAAAFARLAAAITDDGGRLGWLDWAPDRPADGPGSLDIDAELDRASTLPALRAVAVEADRDVAIKRRRGAPVLNDVLREHFRGCRVVLVRGDLPDLPRLRVDDAGWHVAAPGFERVFTAEALAARLRRPRPFESSV